MSHVVSSYAEDNSVTVKSENDDQGLPESPIYSNFSKNLWTSCTRQRRSRSPNRSRINDLGPNQSHGTPMQKEIISGNEVIKN